MKTDYPLDRIQRTIKSVTSLDGWHTAAGISHGGRDSLRLSIDALADLVP